MTRSERMGVVQQATSHTEREHAERVAKAERPVVEMEQKRVALEYSRKDSEGGLAARAARSQRVARGGIEPYAHPLIASGAHDILDGQRAPVEGEGWEHGDTR